MGKSKGKNDRGEDRQNKEDTRSFQEKMAETKDKLKLDATPVVKQEKADQLEIPKNSRLYVNCAFDYIYASHVDKEMFPTLESYLHSYAETLRKQSPDDKGVLDYLRPLGLATEADCYAPMSAAEISAAVALKAKQFPHVYPADKVALYLKDILPESSEPPAPSKQERKPYLTRDILAKKLASQPVAAEVAETGGLSGQKETANTAEISEAGDREQELAGEPGFSYEDGVLRVDYKVKVKGNPSSTEIARKASVRVPKLATADLQNQRSALKETLVELLKFNNFRIRPHIRVVAGKKASGPGVIDFYYGDLSKQFNVVYSMDAGKAMTSGKFREGSIESYSEAKAFRDKNASVDFSTAPRDLKDKIDAAAKVVKGFENQLFNTQTEFTAKGDRRSVDWYVRDTMFENLWKKRIGPEKVKELEELAAPKKTAAQAEAVPIAPADAKLEVKVEKAAEPVKEKTPKKAEEKDKWKMPLPYDDADFRKAAAEFVKTLHDTYRDDWVDVFDDTEAFARLSQKKNKFDKNEYHIGIGKGVRIAAEAFFGANPYADRTDFDRLVAMPKGEVKRELAKMRIYTNNNTKSEMLLRLLSNLAVDNLPEPDEDEKEEYFQQEIEQDQNEEPKVEKPMDSTTSKKQSKEADKKDDDAEDHKGPEVDDGEQEQEREDDNTEEDSSEDVDKEDIFNNAFNIVGEILVEHKELTEENVSERTGLEGQDLEQFLQRALLHMGRLEDFFSILKEYRKLHGSGDDAETDLELMLRMVKTWRELYIKREQARQRILGGEDFRPGTRKVETPKFEDIKLKGLPEYLKPVKAFKEPPCWLLADQVSLQQYVAIANTGGHTFRVLLPPPEQVSMENAEQRKAFVASFADFVDANKQNLAPEIVLPEHFSGKPTDRLDQVLKLGSFSVGLSQEEFLNRNLVRRDYRSSPEYNPYYKLLLLERLHQLRAMGTKINDDAQEKQQLALTLKALQSLLDTPMQQGPSFSDIAVSRAFEAFRKSR